MLAVCDLDSRRAASGKARVEQLFAARKRAGAEDRHLRRLSRAARANGHRRRHDQHARSLARAARARGALRRQGRLSAEADDDDARRGRAAARRGREDRAAFCRSAASSGRGARTSNSARPCEFVRSGRVGNLRRVEIGLPTDPTEARRSARSRCRRISTTTCGSDRRPRSTTPSSACIRRASNKDGNARRQLTSRLAAQRRLLPRHDHRLGRASFRHGALGHERRAHRPEQDRGQGRVPDEQDLERARRVSHRAHVSGQRAS